MSKDAFWELIAEAKKDCGQDLDASADWLYGRLTELGPRQAQDFHDIMHGYLDLAQQYGLGSAASVLCGGCSDDGFTDFRAWLIAQGKEVYLAALKDPDSLADVEPYGWCQFEELSYVGCTALASLTGQNAYENIDPAAYDELITELKKDIVYGEGLGYPYEWNEMADRFPRLCAKYLTPEKLAAKTESEDVWNLNNEEVRAARAAGPQGAAINHPTLQTVPRPKPPEPAPKRDVDQVIAGMRTETRRQIQQSAAPATKLAWYWTYIGSLDMAQQLGLISDERRQALYHEAEPFKPDCIVVEKAPEQGPEASADMTIGGIK